MSVGEGRSGVKSGGLSLSGRIKKIPFIGKLGKKEALSGALFISLSFCGVDKAYLPFLYALICNVGFESDAALMLSLLSLPGAFLFGGIVLCVKSAFVILLVFVFSRLFGRDITYFLKAVLSCVFTLVAGIVANELAQAGLLGLIYVFCEAMLSFGLYFVYATFAENIFALGSKDAFLPTDTLCLSIVAALFLGGFSLLSYEGLNIAFVLGFAALILSAVYFSTAATLEFSVVFGAVLCLTCGYDYGVVATLALCAVFASTAAVLPKTGLCFALLSFGFLLSLLNTATADIKTTLFSFLCAGVTFFALDRIFGRLLFEKTQKANVKPLIMSEAVSAVIGEEIDIQKRMMESISRNITAPEKCRPNEEADILALCRTVAGDVCCGCNMCSRCWAAEAEDTYKCFSEVIACYKADPSIGYDKLPNRFIGKCAKSYFMFKIMCYLCDADNLKNEYAHQLERFKMFMTRQFTHIGKILDKLSDRLLGGLYVNNAWSHEMLSSLQSLGVPAEKLVVVEDFSRRKKYFLTSSKMLGEKTLTKDIPFVLSQAAGRDVRYDYASSKIKANLDFNYTFTEELPHRLSVGVAGCSKDQFAFSGDNISNTTLSNGMHIVALSDGMGSGEEACRQSARVLNMLEEFINAGSDETDSLEMINSILSLEEDAEVFSTLDMFLYDMNTSVGEFVKAGAAPTYIKSGEKITKIAFETLPVGILENMQIKKGVKDFFPNEYVYMMSDGFFECIRNDEEYLLSLIEKHAYRNTQKVAESLFNEALAYSGGKAPDDITVIVAKVR